VCNDDNGDDDNRNDDDDDDMIQRMVRSVCTLIFAVETFGILQAVNVCPFVPTKKAVTRVFLYLCLFPYL